MAEAEADKADHGLLERFDSLRKTGIALLDGGFATHLEDELGQDISSSSLWSASLLDSQNGSKAIIQTHVDFLKAGADVVSTSSYQASSLAFHLAGQSEEKANQLLIKSVQLAQQAKDEYSSQSSSKRESEIPLLLLSLGPYGAALSNGSEYTGDYFIPDPNQNNKSGEPVSMQALEDFHFAQLQILASSSVWSYIELVAFETIPRLDEAIAIRKALQRLFISFPRKLSYASFVFPGGSHLPWPVPKDASYTEDMRTLVEKVVGVDDQGQPSPLMGVGINCTKPKYLVGLVEKLTVALAQVKTSQKPYLFLYPDGGLVWNGITRVWSEESGSHSCELSWADQVMEAAAAAASRKDNGLWAGCFVGGCCKATASDIAALRARLDSASSPLK